MAYTINIILLDFGGFYSAGFPPFVGTLIPFSPPFSADTAVSAPPTPTTLTFPAPTSPPPGPSAVLVRDSVSPGDLFRSGIVPVLPPSPGSLMVFTVPPISLSFAAIAAGAGGGTLFAGMPAAATAIVAALSAGTFIPLGLTITGVVGSTSLAITITGTLLARVFYFATTTYTFTLTFTPVPVPSGDAVNRNRILGVTATAATVVIPGVIAPIAAALAPGIAGVAASMVEGAINTLIAARAATTLTSMGLLLSPTATICARKVAVLPSGVSLQLAFSDLLGAAVLPVPPVVPALKNFSVNVTPAPQEGTQQLYTVAVTDMATGVPVPQASVTLHNFDASGNALTVGPLLTNGNGQATLNVVLRSKKVVKIVTGNPDGPVHDRETIYVSPTLTVTKAGFKALTVTLLVGGP
jgi:hypothetical protein